MSIIQQLQIDNLKKHIKTNMLQSGSKPDETTISRKIQEEITYNIPGTPYYKPINLEAFSISNKDAYNDSFKKLNYDLNIIYNAYNYNEFELSKSKELYDYNMYEIIEILSKLSNEIDFAKEYINRNTKYNSHTIDFFNLEKVNTKDLSLHNINKTTSEINLSNAVLHNTNISTPGSIISISESDINIKSNADTIEIKGDKKSILSVNKMSTLSIKTTSRTKKVHTITIDIDLKNTIMATMVELDALNISDDEIILFVSEDGTNYYRKESIYTSNNTIWNFDKAKFRYLRLLINKGNVLQVNDNEITNTCLVSLKVSKSSFKTNGVFVSSEFDISNSSHVMIIPNQYTPPRTNVIYYVGYKNNDNNIEWIQSDINKYIYLGLHEEEKMFANYSTSDAFGTWDFDREKNKRLFYIHKLKNNYSINSLDVRAGYHQWLIERVDLTYKYPNGIPDNKKVNLNDYSLSNVSGIAPLDLNTNELKCKRNNNYIVMSCYVVCDKEMIIKDRFINYDISKDSDGNDIEIFDKKVLVNGKEVLPTKDRYSFLLRAGENSIKIIILLCNHTYESENSLLTKTIKHNFNLLSVDNEVFAGPKMKRINYNVINEYAHKYKLDQYAVKKDTDGEEFIITKFDPNYVLNPNDPYSINIDDDFYTPTNADTNNSEFFRVLIKYMYMKEDTKNNITDENGNSNIKLRVMSKLLSDNNDTTPFINNIRVVTV